MSESDYDASEIIEAYRKRRERTIPLLLGGLAVVLLVIGIFLVVIWYTGGEGPQLPSFQPSETPTPTITPTPLPPTATPTSTIAVTPTITPTPEPITYIVELGDTLSAIATSFDVDMLVLMAFNGLEDANDIFVGQELTIPSPGQELPTATPLPATMLPGQEIEYVVMPGDSLATIAEKFNSTADAIAKRNDLDDPNTIFVGMRLIVPVDIVTPAP